VQATAKTQPKNRRNLPDDVRDALAQAARAPGWNNRSRDIRRFELVGPHGEACALYVVPFRRWAYRRTELRAAEWHRAHPEFAQAMQARADRWEDDYGMAAFDDDPAAA
jgi:hypothetical protein